MGSLLKNKSILHCVLTVCYIFAQPVWAVDADKNSGGIVDGYYSAYPSVTSTNDPAKDALIKRGEYLSKMGDCIACHTHVEGGTPAYAGGLPINTPFGTFYSPNITPDKETGIGNWTEEDFIRALKEGRNPKGGNYFPVFPYIYFSKVTDEDAKALYAYFMHIPAVKLENKPLPFPFSLPGARLPLWGWNLLFFFPEKESFVYEKTQSPEWNRGRYIVDGLGHCSMCHTPLNPFGAPKTRYYLTGAFIDGYWSPNITKRGIGNASEQEIADVFAKGQLINHAGPVEGPMKEVNHDSLRYLTSADQLAIAKYLKTVLSEEPMAITPSEEPPNLARGKYVYQQTCTICHQDGLMTAPLIGAGPNWFLRLKTNGINGLYRHAIDGYNSMPPKGACVNCSKNDIMAAVDYLLNASLSRSQWRSLKSGGSKQYPQSGKNVYQETCAVCHTEGKDGAPKIGDKAVWTALLAKNNLDGLIINATKSKTHPQNAGCKNCSTEDVLATIKYILKQSDVEGDFALW